MGTVIIIVLTASLMGLLGWMYDKIIWLQGHVRFQDEQMKDLNRRHRELVEDTARLGKETIRAFDVLNLKIMAKMPSDADMIRALESLNNE